MARMIGYVCVQGAVSQYVQQQQQQERLHRVEGKDAWVRVTRRLRFGEGHADVEGIAGGVGRAGDIAAGNTGYSANPYPNTQSLIAGG